MISPHAEIVFLVNSTLLYTLVFTLYSLSVPPQFLWRENGFLYFFSLFSILYVERSAAIEPIVINIALYSLWGVYIEGLIYQFIERRKTVKNHDRNPKPKSPNSKSNPYPSVSTSTRKLG